jgi:hypothetical protein
VVATVLRVSILAGETFGLLMSQIRHAADLVIRRTPIQEISADYLLAKVNTRPRIPKSYRLAFAKVAEHLNATVLFSDCVTAK